MCLQNDYCLKFCHGYSMEFKQPAIVVSLMPNICFSLTWNFKYFQDGWHCEICNHKPGRGFGKCHFFEFLFCNSLFRLVLFFTWHLNFLLSTSILGCLPMSFCCTILLLTTYVFLSVFRSNCWGSSQAFQDKVWKWYSGRATLCWHAPWIS
jgi:hypothetical protein